MIPTVSIITVTKNSEKFLEQTIKSVVNQNYAKIEYLVIDGLSEDATIDIIKNYQDKIDYWISESDKSMYEAINKGLKKSTGDIIAILNSDDYYIDLEVISKVVDFIINKNADAIYGDVIMNYPSNKIYKKLFQVNYDDLVVSGKCTFLPHSTLFIKREILDNIGYYNLHYRFASDFDFILRCLRKIKILYCGFPITSFRRHVDSISLSAKIIPEINSIAKTHRLEKKRYFFYLKFLYLWTKYYSVNILYRILKYKCKI